MNTQATGATAPQNPIQNLTPITQAFISLSGSVAVLFDIQGVAKENEPYAYDVLINDAQHLIQCAEQCRAEKQQADRAFIQTLFDAVPVASVGGAV